MKRDIIHCGDYIVDLSAWWKGDGEIIIFKREKDYCSKRTKRLSC